jgi:hypothetical protein
VTVVNSNNDEALQSSYLMDHLKRACKIDKRTTVSTCTQACVLDLSHPLHQGLWSQVFPDAVPATDQNVSVS